MAKATAFTLFTDRTTTGTSTAYQLKNHNKNFMAFGSVSESTGSATILCEGSVDGVTYVTIGTISLTLGVAVTSGKVSDTSPWPYVRVNVSAISGTNAKVSVYLIV